MQCRRQRGAARDRHGASPYVSQEREESHVLIAAIVVLTVAFGLGLWLGCLYMLVERPPGRLTWIGGLHGAAGTAGVGVLLLALHGPPQGVRLGAGPFGKIAGALLVAAPGRRPDGAYHAYAQAAGLRRARRIARHLRHHGLHASLHVFFHGALGSRQCREACASRMAEGPRSAYCQGKKNLISRLRRSFHGSADANRTSREPPDLIEPGHRQHEDRAQLRRNASFVVEPVIWTGTL